MADRVTGAIVSLSVNDLWWMGVVQGTLAVFFGVTAIFWPGLTLVTLVYLFSAFVIAIGLTEIVNGLMSVKRRTTWWMTLLIGVITLGAGIYLARHPNVSFATFILITGLTLIAKGILDIVRSFIDRASTANRALNIIVGLAAIVAGIIILLQPVSGGIAFVWVLGLYALLFGTLTMAVSFELRRELQEEATAPAKERAAERTERTATETAQARRGGPRRGGGRLKPA